MTPGVAALYGQPQHGPPSLSDLYEHAPCGYLTASPDGVVLQANATLLRSVGCSRDAVVGRPFADLLSVGSRLFYETRCLPVLRLAGEVSEVALVLRRPDGSDLHVLVNSRVLADAPGGPGPVLTAVFDATGRQDYERDLLEARRAAEQSEARVRVLQHASTTFGSARTVAAVAAAAAGIARTACDATSSTLMLVAGDVLQPATTGYPLEAPVPLAGDSPEAEALRGGRVVTVSGLEAAERDFPALVDPLYDARLAALSAAPLYEDHAPLGVLVCHFGRRRDFGDDEVHLQRAIAEQAAQALLRVRLQEQLQHLALHDPLTGLANRELLQHRLVQVLAAAARSRRPMALIFLDLDGFKAINDALGHAVGDSVLVQVADRLRDTVRVSDTVARFGGDEFVVVCEDAEPGTSTDVAERIRAAVRQPLAGVPASFPLTASVGLAVHCPGAAAAPAADALVVRADDAMYRAKRAGKDRVVVDHV